MLAPPTNKAFRGAETTTTAPHCTCNDGNGKGQLINYSSGRATPIRTSRRIHFVDSQACHGEMPGRTQKEMQDDIILVEPKEMADITTILEEAAGSLTMSDPMLCNFESFNLQDSMAALEMMDRKMDCCELPAPQVAPFGVTVSSEKMVFPRPAPTGLEDAIEPLPWEDLTIKDAAYIALETLVRLESLLSGASVVESTFTCFYAHRPVLTDIKARLQQAPESLTEHIQSIVKPKRSGTVAQNVVYASTLILLELTDVVRSVILNADIYEEEDFSVSTFNIAVFDDRDETTATEAVVDVLEMLSTLDEHESDEVRAISLMLGFQLDFLTVCTSTVSPRMHALLRCPAFL